MAESDKKAAAHDHDRVVMASRLPDGTPAQTEDFEFIGDPEFVEEAAKRQLGEQAASAKDTEVRVEQAREAREGQQAEPEMKELQKAQEQAIKAAESKASSEVKSRHADK